MNQIQNNLRDLNSTQPLFQNKNVRDQTIKTIRDWVVRTLEDCVEGLYSRDLVENVHSHIAEVQPSSSSSQTGLQLTTNSTKSTPINRQQPLAETRTPSVQRESSDNSQSTSTQQLLDEQLETTTEVQQEATASQQSPASTRLPLSPTKHQNEVNIGADQQSSSQQPINTAATAGIVATSSTGLASTSLDLEEQKNVRPPTDQVAVHPYYAQKKEPVKRPQLAQTPDHLGRTVKASNIYQVETADKGPLVEFACDDLNVNLLIRKIAGDGLCGYRCLATKGCEFQGEVPDEQTVLDLNFFLVDKIYENFADFTPAGFKEGQKDAWRQRKLHPNKGEETWCEDVEMTKRIERLHSDSLPNNLKSLAIRHLASKANHM